MVFKLEPDFLALAQDNISKGYRAGKAQGWPIFVKAAAVLALWLAGAYAAEISASFMISGTIAVSALVVVASINARAATTEADIVHASGAVEYFGQRILDEMMKRNGQGEER